MVQKSVKPLRGVFPSPFTWYYPAYEQERFLQYLVWYLTFRRVVTSDCIPVNRTVMGKEFSLARVEYAIAKQLSGLEEISSHWLAVCILLFSGIINFTFPTTFGSNFGGSYPRIFSS